MMIGLTLSLLLVASAQETTATATPPTAIPASATTDPAADPDPVICHTRLIPSERVGARYRTERTCLPRSEWKRTAAADGKCKDLVTEAGRPAEIRRPRSSGSRASARAGPGAAS